MDLQVVTCYTDGSCLGNPGVGGFAASVKTDEIYKIIKGYSHSDAETNNSMELKAVMHVVEFCVRAVKKPARIIINTDSQYVCSCWNHDKHWLMTKDRPNREIWIQIIKNLEKSGHKIEFVKIPAHSGIELNERVDRLAREQAVTARHILFGGKNGRR